MKSQGGRIEWIDHGRGVCIILVVMLYAAEWIGDAVGRQGWLAHAVEFARPFRMPAFFIISGLLLYRTIDRPWREYLDRKVLHFAYFYFLWLVITFVFMGRSMASHDGWDPVIALFLRSIYDPFYWLWFIYMLPVFFVATRLVAKLPVALIWTVAAALHVAELETGIKVFDKFSAYYVFFYSGYAFFPLAFRIAEAAASRPLETAGLVAAWAALEVVLVFGGYADVPLFSLALAFVGAAILIAAVALMPRSRVFSPVRYCGEHSLVIYLAFFLPMLATRAVLTRIDAIDDVTVMELLAMTAGVLGPLAAHAIVRRTPLRFVFERPRSMRLAPRRAEVPDHATHAGSSPEAGSARAWSKADRDGRLV